MIGGLALVLMVTLPAAPGVVTGTVTLTRDGAPAADRSGVVVYLEGVPASRKELPPQEIHQRDKTFVPGLVVLSKGGAVDFPNDDLVFHNVFSLSRPARFDLGLYKSGSSKRVVFDRPGVVEVFCNIHPRMIATVVVLDSGHYAVTDAAGAFRIEGVPPGTWPWKAWVRGGEQSGTVAVLPGQAAIVSVAVDANLGVPSHLRKDGTPYGRYE